MNFKFFYIIDDKINVIVYWYVAVFRDRSVDFDFVVIGIGKWEDNLVNIVDSDEANRLSFVPYS